MENVKLIEGILEGQGLTQEQTAEILEEMARLDLGPIDPTTPRIRELDLGNLELQLRAQMDDEKDWRKKASLAARIISIGLE
jgi:hypothetical protein